jgi:carbonic anhydrase/acetyltransferase-like protein (isoleucine patch superfamily)
MFPLPSRRGEPSSNIRLLGLCGQGGEGKQGADMKYSFEDRRIVCKGDYWIAENAIVIGSVVLENNASVWFNCVLRGDNDVITLGENSQLQDGCVVHVDPGHPLTLGKDVSIGHMAMLHGCTVGDGTLVGIKSVILNDAVIGRNCVIGANSLIAEGKKIPDGSLVLGSPGKVVRQLTEDEIKRFSGIAGNYVRKWKRYKEGLKPDLSQ